MDFQQAASDFDEAVSRMRERIQLARNQRQAVAIRIVMPYQTASGDFEIMTVDVGPSKLPYEVDHGE